MFILVAMLTVAAAHTNPEGLICRTQHDRIDITLPVDLDRRIGSLAVVRGAKWAVLADEQNHYAPFHSGVRHLALRPSRQIGSVDGRPTRAFPMAGAYRIVFADNLETEPDNMIALDCLVRVR